MYQADFTCDFDLVQYPFDKQICLMKFKIRSASVNLIKWNEAYSKVQYAGEKLLLENIVGDLSMEFHIIDNYSFIFVSISCH